MKMAMNWGTGAALAYSAFACGTLGMLALAMSQPVDLVSADYYARSLRQNERIAATANAREMAEPVTVVYDRAGSAVTIDWPTGFETATGTVTFYRPSQAAADREFPVAPARRRQTIETAALASGRWRVQMTWSLAGRDYYQETELALP